MTHNERNLKANLAASYNELVSSFTALSCETIGNYTLGKVIGKGSYGKAYQATHKFLGSKVVLKSTPKSEAPNLAREIHHHRHLHHPHVAQLYEVIVTESKVWLVLELCSNGELYEHLIANRQLDEDEAQRIFAQICGAVAYIHSKGIVHRDLKLENVFLDRKNNAKLGDFGFTRENNKMLLSTWCGSLSYCAPEVVRGDKYQGEVIDVWSLGIILFALLSGNLPFDEVDESITRRMILEEKQIYPPFFSDTVKDLLDRMLSKTPEDRPLAIDVLKHPFLASHAAAQFTLLDQPYSPTFESRLERTVLERLGVSGVETEKVIANVLDYKCDSLCGWWWLSLARERRRERRHRIAKRRSADLTAESNIVDTRASSRRRSRSRQGSGDLGNVTGSAFHFPLGFQSPGPGLSNNPSPLMSTMALSSKDVMSSHTVTEITDWHTDAGEKASGRGALTPTRRFNSEPARMSTLSTPPTSNTLGRQVSDSPRSGKDGQAKKTGLLQSVKHWWIEQTKSHRATSPTSNQSPASAVATQKTNQNGPGMALQPEAKLLEQELVESDSPSSGRLTNPRVPQRPVYRRRRSSQQSSSSRGPSMGRPPTLMHLRSDHSSYMHSPASPGSPAVKQSLRSPGLGDSATATNPLDKTHPPMQRTMSASSNQSSVASYRGSGQAGHSKASSTSSNSTFASTTRSIRAPRNSLKVMPSTPPPFMIAHQGGYKERNIFEQSLAGPHGSLAFATRKKAKRGVLLQVKPKSRRRISLNEADLIEEEEESGGEEHGMDEFVNVEESESVLPLMPEGSRSLLDLVEEQEDDGDSVSGLEPPLLRDQPVTVHGT